MRDSYISILLNFVTISDNNILMHKLLLINFILVFFAKTLLSSELPLLKININELYVDGYYTKVNYELENKYEKLIKLADHTMIVRDLLGEEILRFQIKKDLYLASNEKKVFDANFITDGLSGHERLKIIKFDDLVFDYKIKTILFEDNSKIEIQYED